MGDEILLSGSLVFWLLAIPGVLLTGISKSGFAGGAGVVAVPLLALLIPVTQALALMLPLLILMDMRAVYLYRNSIQLRLLLSLLPAAIVGIAAGGFMMGLLTDFSLLLLLGVISVLFAAWQRLAPQLSQLRGAGWLWGSLSGMTSTLIHAGGPPLNIYLLGQQLPKLVWLATASVFFAAMNLVKIIPYLLIGAWQNLPWMTVLLLVPVAYAGVGLGHKLQQTMSEKTFTFLCRFLLGATGVMLIIKSVWPYIS